MHIKLPHILYCVYVYTSFTSMLFLTNCLCLMFLQEVPRELYGPVMVVLTMIALLLYQMKSADHKVVSVYRIWLLCFTQNNAM